MSTQFGTADSVDIGADLDAHQGEGERRRPGRLDDAHPNLIDMLRDPAAPASFPNAADERSIASPTPSNGACAACREGVQIFPFTMAFQPIVDMQENRIDAYEALVRGMGAEGAGHVLGQVNAGNRYAFDQACRVKAIELAARLGMDRQLSINFLPNAVYDPRACIRTTLKTAARTGFRLDQLTFEILESESIADVGHIRNIISEYRRYGFKIALDDFGTGYSGLARLAELKPDIVKIDRAIVTGCDRDSTRLAILAGMIRIGAEIGVKIVIEGVERLEEVEALRSVGARFIQGFHFAKPLFEGIARDADICWPRP